MQANEDLTRHRTRNKNFKSDAQYVRDKFNYNDSSNMSNKIKGLKKKYATALKDLGIDDLDSKSLPELDDLLKSNKIELISKRKTDWISHEKDVVDGINDMFKSGIFVLKTSKSETELVDNKNFFAEQAGGATQSDVKVCHGKKSFFIECKLNFEAAEYFKYGLKISDKTIKYDHKKYIDGLDLTEDKLQIEKIDKLFTKDINLDGFLNKLVNDKNVKAGWEKFLKNATDVEKFIAKSPEFKDFTKNVHFTKTWPDDFKGFVNVFDTYCKYYMRKYDLLIDLLFGLFDSDDLEKEDYAITKHNDAEGQHVFKSLAVLQSDIDEMKLQIFNKSAFSKTVLQILVIEAKFNALLQVLGYEDDISRVLKLKDKEKTKYFFKMFISSVGRKTKDSEYNSLSMEDELGNMQICSAIPVKTNELAKLITAFYVKKDNCAYILIADAVYLFSKDLNPFNIPELPIFSECMTLFNVMMSVSDDLKRIGLHVKALHPNDALLSSKNLLSFKKKDSNYIPKKIDLIMIQIR